MALCSATSKTTLQPCQRPAIPGGNVCIYHGGKSENVIRAAQRRLLSAVDDVTAALVAIAGDATIPVRDRIKAITEVLDRAGLTTKHQLEVSHVEGNAKEELKALLDDLAELEAVNSVDELPT